MTTTGIDDPTIEDLTEAELEELAEAGRITDDGEILPAKGEGDEQGDEQDDDVTEEEGEGTDKADGKTGDEAEAAKGKEAGADADAAKSDDGKKDDDPDTVMIPKARLDQEARRRRELEEEYNRMQQELAFHKGRDSARNDVPSDGKGDKKQDMPTVETIEAQIDEIWQKAEDGDITLVEARKLERAKQGEIEAVRQSSQTPDKSQKADAEPNQAQVLIDREVNREALRIANEHPYINHMSEADITYLSSKVDEQIKSENLRVPRNEIDRSIWRMDLIGKMSDKLGPGLTGKTLEPSSASTSEPSPEQKSQLAKAKAEQRSDKLKTAAQQPPNSITTGTATGGLGDMTADRFESLSEAEREALPPAVLERMLNS